MKLKFTINYGTQWGESLHVVISYKSLDGTVKTFNLLMQTEDGVSWSLDTAVVESRQHPIDSFTYYYQVEDGEGRVLRREWTGVPRAYHFDSSKNYVLPDLWRDIPLNYHLYSSAYRITMGMTAGESAQVMRVPFYRKTILFRVSAPQLRHGQSLAILGSHPALGDWNTARFLRMDYIGDNDWILSVNVDAIFLPIEYKYVIVDDTTNSLVAWEDGDNRTTEGLLPADQNTYPTVRYSLSMVRDCVSKNRHGERQEWLCRYSAFAVIIHTASETSEIYVGWWIGPWKRG
jgi:4-alpha-glucanotransferase